MLNEVVARYEAIQSSKHYSLDCFVPPNEFYNLYKICQVPSLRAKRGNPEYRALNSGLPRFARNDGTYKLIAAACNEDTVSLSKLD